MAIWGDIIKAGIGGLASYLTSGAEQEAARKMQERQFRMQQKEARYQEEQNRARKAAARGYLGSYGYTPYGQAYNPYELKTYESALRPQAQTTLAQFLSGELTPVQQQTLARQRTLGEEQIGRTAAGTGMTAGGRAALSTQLARDIALGGGQMAAEQQKYALQSIPTYETMAESSFYKPQEFTAGQKEKAYTYNLADWLRQQRAAQEKAKMMASYA